jgi:TolB-like protein
LAGLGWLAAARGWVPGMARKAPVLAILPFQNGSPVPDESNYFKEGLGDGLVLKFSGAKECRVLPWTTTRRLVDSTATPQRIAQSLGAGLLLVGSFRSQDDRLHVTAALVDGKSGVQLWTQAFRRTLDGHHGRADTDRDRGPRGFGGRHLIR